MRKILFLAAMMSLAPVSAVAQVAPPVNTTMDDTSRRGTVPSASYCVLDGAWSPCAGRVGKENFTLASSNTPSPAATLYGGTYVFSQTCGSYGTVALRYRGPDGATQIVMLTKTASDTNGGTVVAFGSNAIVDVTLTGTAACNVTLARIPS